MRPEEWEDEAEEAPAPGGSRGEERALRELRALYRQADAAYAPFSCAASGECCQLAVTRRQPWLWHPEWRLLTRARPLPPPRADGGCPWLDGAGRRCTVYEDRPFGCRTFFCPSRQPADTVIALLRRLERLSQRVLPSLSGPRPLLEWHAEASAPARTLEPEAKSEP
jgi:hypothetical protein